MKLMILVGNGRKIGLFSLPFLLLLILIHWLKPDWLLLNTPIAVKWLSVAILIPGTISWIWSVFLIVTKIPQKELITEGPFAVCKHPLYTGVSLLVLPWIGFLFHSWAGLIIGIVMYIGSRIYAPGEEVILQKVFGHRYTEYGKKVWLPWL